MYKLSCTCTLQSAVPNWLELKKAEKSRSTTQVSDRERMAKELGNLLDEPNEAENSDPFEWWRSNQFRYSIDRAVVARLYLGIPATSVASERIFSKCSRVCSERRSVLSPAHVEQLVFLSHNFRAYE